MSSKLRHPVQVKLFDHLQRQQITAENPDLSIQIGRVIILSAGVGCVPQALQHRVRLIDGDASHGIVNGCGAQSCNQGRAENQHKRAQYYPLPFDENSQVLAQNRILRSQCRMNCSQVAAELHGNGNDFTQELIVRLQYWRRIHQPPQPKARIAGANTGADQCGDDWRNSFKVRVSVWQRTLLNGLD